MAKMPIFDDDSGDYVGEFEIPDDVLEAAARVEAWLKAQVGDSKAWRLNGLRLAD